MSVLWTPCGFPWQPPDVLRLLLEGMSVRSVERVTSVHRDTILKLIVLAGDRCRSLMQERIRGVNVTDVQVDEIWGYVFKKEGHKWNHEKDIDDIGDAYCFVALERNTKRGISFEKIIREGLKPRVQFFGRLWRG